MSLVVSWIAFVLGGLLCLANFHLSFFRLPLHLLRGGSRESYRFVSGVPVFGSFLVALSLLLLHGRPGIVPAAVSLIAIDTGGIHWFIGAMIHQAIRERRRG